MVSMDISLTPSLPGATLSLSSSLNKRVLGDYMRVCFFGRLRLRQKEGVTRISKSKRDRGGGGGDGGGARRRPAHEHMIRAGVSMCIRVGARAGRAWFEG